MSPKGLSQVTPSSQQEAREGADATVTRRPYKSPELRHLGSVRELTLGSTMGIFADGGTTMRTMP